jgi:predicted nucleic acid-binding protein
LRYVLDASVAVAALRKMEPFHAESLRRCMPLFRGEDEISVPAIFDLEVTSALARRGADPSLVQRFFERHLASRVLVTIGPRSVSAVQDVIRRTKLRAADALYVWAARRSGLELITADREILTRAALVGVSASPP